MSDPVSQPTDADALRRAVRPLRLAAASFVDPLGVLSLSLAAAETVQTELLRELPLASFTPFGMLPNTSAGSDPVAAAAGAATSAAAGRRASPAATSPRAPSTSSFPTATELLADLGSRPAPTGESASGAAASPGRPSRSSLPTVGDLLGQVGAHPAPATRPAPRSVPEEVGNFAVQAVGELEALLAKAKSNAPAPQPPSSGDVVTRTLGELGTGVAAVASIASETVARLAVPPPSFGEVVAEAFQAIPGAAAPPKRSASPPAQVTRADATGQDVARTLADAVSQFFPGGTPAAGIAGAAAAVGGAAVTVAAETVAALTGQSANGAGPLGSLGRALLDSQLGPASGATASGSAAPRTLVPAAPSPVPIPYPNVGANGSGTQPVAEAPQLEPGDLAWLVNEALIEQARLHGVDLS